MKPIQGLVVTILLTLIFLVSGCGNDNVTAGTTNNTAPTTQPISHTDIKPVTVVNWNLQAFGDSKASDETLMQDYANVITQFDIVFVQEIKDEDGSAFQQLCSLLPDYDCKASSRAGTTSNQEQYGVIYKKNIKIDGWVDFNLYAQSQKGWERPPIAITFDIDGYNLTTFNIHIDPDDVKRELSNLEIVLSSLPSQGNIMIIGDLNADCKYYNPGTNTEFDNWHWIIKDSDDTTVSENTDCAYDRIILNDDANKEYMTYGIYREGITGDLSDHYPIWVELRPSDS